MDREAGNDANKSCLLEVFFSSQGLDFLKQKRVDFINAYVFKTDGLQIIKCRIDNTKLQ